MFLLPTVRLNDFNNFGWPVSTWNIVESSIVKLFSDS